jgi:predicted GNAT family acetyltransferase
MVVAQAERGRGLGTALLGHLKQHCYATGYRPICSCAADNAVSKRAIEKAGFVSEHRMVTVLF